MAGISLDCVIIPPHHLHTHTHTVVFLHGRGDTAKMFSRSLLMSPSTHHASLFAAFPSFRWVFPQAPMRRCASSPDTWPQWFDVWNVRNFADREDLQAEGLKEVVPAIRGMLANEAALLGGRWDRVVLAGISMGAATGVHVLLNLDVPAAEGGKIAAFIGFSCRCPFVGRDLQGMRKILELQGVPGGDDVVRRTPVLLEHCIDDPLVLVQNGRAMRDTLRGLGSCVVEWREYPDGGHWFNSPVGMDDAVEFLKRYVLDESILGGLFSAEPQTSSEAMDLS